MASIFVVLMCAVANAFLLYVLFQFTRELRRKRSRRAVTAVVRVVTPVEDSLGAKVIAMTSGRHARHQILGQRRVS
jgi:hypothetical protein